MHLRFQINKGNYWIEFNFVRIFLSRIIKLTMIWCTSNILVTSMSCDSNLIPIVFHWINSFECEKIKLSHVDVEECLPMEFENWYQLGRQYQLTFEFWASKSIATTEKNNNLIGWIKKRNTHYVSFTDTIRIVETMSVILTKPAHIILLYSWVSVFHY